MGKGFDTRHRFVIFRVSILIICAIRPGLTQQTPAPDDPAVLLGYFSLHHALNEAATTNPTLRHEAAMMMGISDTEFTLATHVADSVLGQLQDISRSISAKHLDVETAHQIEARRKVALNAGLGALREQLPPSSWAALHRYINVTYRAGLRSEVIPAR